MSDQGFDSMGGGSYPPPPPAPMYAPPPVQRRGNGKLTAGGVLQIIEGALTAIVALWLFAVTQSDIGGFADDLTGGSITFMAVILLILAVALIWTGALCIKARKGGWVTVVVFQGIFTAFSVIGILGSASNDAPIGGGLVSAAYCGTALYLAASGGKQSQA